jgi:hypothetical protein
VTVQRALGHAKATTLDTYSHLWPTAEDRTRNAQPPCSPRRRLLLTSGTIKGISAVVGHRRPMPRNTV